MKRETINGNISDHSQIMTEDGTYRITIMSNEGKYYKVHRFKQNLDIKFLDFLESPAYATNKIVKVKEVIRMENNKYHFIISSSSRN